MTQIGYIGCELTDIPVMKKVGFAVAVADAIPEVKELAITSRRRRVEGGL